MIKTIGLCQKCKNMVMEGQLYKIINGKPFHNLCARGKLYNNFKKVSYKTIMKNETLGKY